MNENPQLDIAKKFEHTKKCRHCQSDIPEKAKVCPVCKKKQSKFWRDMGILLIIIIILAALTDTEEETTSNSESNSIEATTETTPAPITKDTTPNDGVIDFTENNCSLKYLRHEMKVNAAGDKCLAVYYLFTNNSESSTSFAYTFNDKAFQNGIELEKPFFLLEGVDDNDTNEIKPGYSVEVYSLFETRDNSIVELEITEWISFNGTPLDNMQLSLE